MIFPNCFNAGMWRIKALLILGLVLGAPAAKACTTVADRMDPSAGGTGVEWQFTGVGEPLMGWVRYWGNPANPDTFVYRSCSGSGTQRVVLAPALSLYSEDDASGGAAIFNVGNGVGVQFSVAIQDASGSWLSDENVSSTGIEVDAPVIAGDVQVRIWYRYIATADPGSASTLTANAFSWNISGSGPAYRKVVSSHSIGKYIPPPAPSCGFDLEPPGDVALSHTTLGMLERDGSGPPKEFSWKFSCNSTASGSIVTYRPGTASGGRPTGRMAIESGPDAAKGVEFEVRRATTASGAKSPVRFDSAYYPGKSGTEYLDVRYVHTGDPLQAGKGNGSLTVELDVY